LGYIKVKATVANPFNRDVKLDVEFVADTGAIYTMIPKSIAEELKLEETGRRRFKIASGETVEYPVSEAYITVEDRGVTSLVVIGPEKSIPLLGTTTLELLGLQVDPVSGKLKPLELMML